MAASTTPSDPMVMDWMTGSECYMSCAELETNWAVQNVDFQASREYTVRLLKGMNFQDNNNRAYFLDLYEYMADPASDFSRFKRQEVKDYPFRRHHDLGNPIICDICKGMVKEATCHFIMNSTTQVHWGWLVACHDCHPYCFGRHPFNEDGTISDEYDKHYMEECYDTYKFQDKRGGNDSQYHILDLFA